MRLNGITIKLEPKKHVGTDAIELNVRVWANMEEHSYTEILREDDFTTRFDQVMEAASRKIKELVGCANT